MSSQHARRPGSVSRRSFLASAALAPAGLFLPTAAGAQPVAFNPLDPLGSIDKMLGRVQKVFRVQLCVKTSQTKGGDTDDKVQARLNHHAYTWLETARDDFRGGAVDTFDLMTFDDEGNNPIKKLDDIAYLKLYKPDKDDWFVDWVQLLVNGKVVYEKIFKQPLRLGDDKGSTREWEATGDDLRAAQGWKDFKYHIPGYRKEQTRLAMVIPRVELKERVEGLVGHLLHSRPEADPARWRGQPGVRRASPDSVMIDLPFKWSVNNWPDYDVDVAVEVRFKTAGSLVTIDVADVKVRIEKGFGRAVKEKLDKEFKNEIREKVQKFREELMARDLSFDLLDGVPGLEGFQNRDKLPFYTYVYKTGDVELGFGEKRTDPPPPVPRLVPPRGRDGVVPIIP